MSSFAKWIIDQDRSRDADLAALQSLVKNQANWPYWSNKLSDYLAAMNAIQPAPPNLNTLKDKLEDLFTQWISEEQRRRSLIELFITNIGTILLGGAAVLFLGFIFYGLHSTDFYSSLTRIEQGRGLITFVFALTATAVILIVSISIFWFENTDDLLKRIIPAKDVLTVVIGVLGTIMGFYFGSTVDGRLSISNITLTPAIAKPADKVIKLQATMIGGTVPYQYTITFGDSSISKSSPTAVIEESLDISKLSGLTNVTISIAVTDGRGNQAHSATVLPIQTGTPTVPPPAQSGAAPVDSQGNPLALGTVDVSPDVAKAGTSVSVKTKITGGSPPYTVSAGYSGTDGTLNELLAPKQSAVDVAETITIPSNAVPGKIKLIITVKDKSNVSIQASKELTVEE